MGVQVKRVTVLLYRPTHLPRKPHQLPSFISYLHSTLMETQPKITRNLKRKKKIDEIFKRKKWTTDPSEKRNDY